MSKNYLWKTDGVLYTLNFMGGRIGIRAQATMLSSVVMWILKSAFFLRTGFEVFLLSRISVNQAMFLC